MRDELLKRQIAIICFEVVTAQDEYFDRKRQQKIIHELRNQELILYKYFSSHQSIIESNHIVLKNISMKTPSQTKNLFNRILTNEYHIVLFTNLVNYDELALFQFFLSRNSDVVL